MGTPHKHRDVIIAWANGEEIQMLSGDTWLDVPEFPKWHECNKYRIKPKRVKKEGWVNVHGDEIGIMYGSKERADKSLMKDRKACVRIEWEEEE